VFERRLKILLWAMAVLAVGLVARLVQLQVIRADVYQDEARKMLLRPIRLVPCVRGRILDRAGSVLAEDRPCWDVCVPYGILAGEPDYLAALAGQLRASEPGKPGRVTSADLEQLRNRISAMWPAIAQATGTGLDELAERREVIVQYVRGIREAVRQKHGVDRRIAEERLDYPMVRGLNHGGMVEARIALSPFPWVQIVASTKRQYAPEVSMAHVLGRLEDVDPDDATASEWPDVLHGIWGAERLGEDRLHGRRGSIREDLGGQEAEPPVEPANGEDIRLTIITPLQKRVYQQLSAAIREYPQCTGASAVVIDVPAREVLAAVDFPSYDPNAGWAARRELEADRKTLPTEFRAVSGLYPPGSIVKPLVLAAALTDRTVTPETQIECRGRLFMDIPNAFRCTAAHGPMAARAAMAHSCNVYFFTVGEWIGVPRLRYWFDLAGFGRHTGTGLREEAVGHLPEKVNRGDARNAAIGQGDLEITPLQAANLMATVASGQFRPVTILRDDPRERPARSLGVAESDWAVVRSGMYAVVNEPGGTAYGRVAPPPAPWVLLGKTGSAEGWRRELDRVYTCEWPDGTREEYVATDAAELKRRLADRGPFTIAGWRANRRWPPEEQAVDTHGWFAGYMIDRDDWARPGREPRRAVAIAVLLEYAGHGGTVAGPVAGEIAQMVLEYWPEKG
jgi:penicillin-binding protein 2